jgi:DNA helicase HerA-like ATPase
VPNTIRHLTVIDEAHRISPFRAVQTMVREARSKGAAVILATQQPQDLPEVVAANAQTKICFGLPDAAAATVAARRLDPDGPRLAETIRSLPAGEAFVSFAGRRPVRVRMAQAWRDSEALGIGR